MTVLLNAKLSIIIGTPNIPFHKSVICDSFMKWNAALRYTANMNYLGRLDSRGTRITKELDLKGTRIIKDRILGEHE